MNELNEKPVLKISFFAMYVIECDKRAFSTETQVVSASNLINRVICNYAEVSNMVRDNMDIISETELKKLFGRMRITLTKSNLIDFRAGAKKNVEKYRYPDDATELRISLSNEALAVLDVFLENDVYAPLRSAYSKGETFSAAMFVSALVEEYVSLPMFRRESIYYSDLIKKATEAIRLNNEGEDCYLKIDTNRISNIYIYPVDILLDEWSTYNYLVGIGIFDSSKGEMPMSIRISNIRSIKSVISDRILVFHNQPMIDNLHKCIKSRGVMFLGSPYTEGEKIRVLLTPSGFAAYNNVMFLRPRYDSDEILDNGNHIMTFSCTQFQVKQYFKRLGGDAEILEPASLRNEFAQFFHSANQRYNNE